MMSQCTVDDITMQVDDITVQVDDITMQVDDITMQVDDITMHSWWHHNESWRTDENNGHNTDNLVRSALTIDTIQN